MQRRQGWLYIFLFFLFITILVFLIFKTSLLNPFKSLTQNLFFPISSTIHNIIKIDDKKQQGVQEKTLDLSKKIIDQTKLETDNKALRDQFETTTVMTSNLIPAVIVGSPAFIPGVTLPENLILQKGEVDGVRKGQLVIYKDNLVGRIAEVSGNYSKVTLLTNQAFSLTAQTLSTNAIGVAKGQGSGEIILDNVVLSDALNVGDLVRTKGDLNIKGEGVYPNLILGKIISINKNPSSLFQTAKIKTLLDFSHLSTVFIIKN